MSERDREQIARLTGPERIHVLPNCVDSLAKPLLDEPANGAPAILLLGLFLHPPNADAARWMLEEIFPLVRGSLPACTLYLVGGGAPRYLERMAAQPGVCLTGRVEDVALSYARCQIAVAPLRAGGGTRLKILEAMSFGRPVVATSTGAEGLPVNSGEHLMLADTAEDFARACVGLLRDPALRSRLRRNARSFVERGYRWDDCAERHLRIYEALIRKGALTPERAR
jgi:glycosyltransferase involved in cell wall biosynthesis